MLTAMHTTQAMVAVGEYTIGSAKHIRAIIEADTLAEIGTRELCEYLMLNHPQADCAGLKNESVRLLAAAGCYPLVTKKDGSFYGPKSVAEKAKAGRYVLDEFGQRCIKLAFALERMIERAVPDKAKGKNSRQMTTSAPEISGKAENNNAPQTVTQTKIVNQPSESVRSQLAALLARALEMAVENSDLSEVIKQAMTLLPKI